MHYSALRGKKCSEKIY